ncbi:hypothetical protein [Microbacterium sp. Marseille-Q6648]|uniref:hypothetical protein n=1 Tax=Microbacterium sp. Marseille-Q6648 TaxID=2937991 RepID=UPI00203BA035|nr:hypothetical protein [Microbacterium sp. Marseille-Q6648]
MTARLAPTILAIGLLTAALTACDATPDPVETPPAFASEEEAFAAAEETYRAYVDAVNEVDLSDPSSFDPVFELTTGELNASDRRSFSDWHAEGYVKSGAASVVEVRSVGVNESYTSVTIDVCYDVSQVKVVDENGASLVGADRPDIQPLRIFLSRSATAEPTLRVSSIESSGASLRC